MTNNKHKKKGKEVLARKPHGYFAVKESKVIDGQRLHFEYIVADFTSKSL